MGIKLQQPSWTPSWIPPLCPTSWMSTQVFFNRLWVPYKDQESKLGDIWLHTGPPSAPGLSSQITSLAQNYATHTIQNSFTNLQVTSVQQTFLNFWSFHHTTKGVIRGGWGAVAPKEKEKRKKKKEKEKKKKNQKERKKGTMNNVKLLHIKCCFFQFFNSPVALKNKKNFGHPKKVEMTSLHTINSIYPLISSCHSPMPFKSL